VTTARAATIVCFFAALFALGGCARSTRVLSSGNDAGGPEADANHFGNAEPRPEIDSAADAGAFMYPNGPGSPIGTPTRRVPVLSTEWVDRDTCSGDPIEILTGTDEIQDLAITSNAVYAATLSGVLRTGRDGGDAARLIDGSVYGILADEHNLFWVSPDDLQLYVQDVHAEDGEVSVFLPTHAAIYGLSQDDDSIYAVPYLDLVHVSKQTKAVSTLVEYPTVSLLQGCGTAVGDSFVYFISDPEGGNDLQRVPKDGGDREMIAADFAEVTVPEMLLVDESYAYVAGDNAIARISLADGAVDTLVAFPGLSFFQPFMAQDERCIYYADRGALICIAKSDGSRELLLELDDVVFRAIAKRDSDLYFGVQYLDAAREHDDGWVGRITCQGGN
jgi:hypothetical protein